MEKRWDLTALCEGFDTPRFGRDMAALEADSAAVVENMRAILTAPEDEARRLEHAVCEMCSWEKLKSIGEYAYLVLAVDADDERALKTCDITDALDPNFTLAKTLFESHVAGIDSAALHGYIDGSPLLREHAYFFDEIIEKSAHKLTVEQEYVLAKLFPTGGGAWGTMHSALIASHLVPITIDGEEKRLPLSVVRNMYYDANPKTRKTAYEAELAAYELIERPAAFALNSIKGEAITVSELRGYKSPLAMTLLDARMEQKTLDALVSAIEEFLPSLRRFYNKKAAMLGHGDGSKGLPFYDIFAPVGKANLRFTYPEAVDYVIKHISKFSKNVGEYMRRAVDNNWLDVYPRSGKQGGAFCLNLHQIKESRFLLNFDGSFDSLTTIAHELGHGYHGHRLKDESALNCEYTMPIAETSSTMSETIVYQAALKTTAGDERTAILENSISGALQVVIDIYSRYLFESAIFSKRVNGSLSAAEFKAEMIAAQKKAYGGGLDENLLHPYMWINKTHYYNSRYNFYNFPYAYGRLFALGLYAQYEKDGAAFADKYDALLSATGKNTLEAVASIAGIDVTDKEFWRCSLAVIEADVEKFLSI